MVPGVAYKSDATERIPSSESKISMLPAKKLVLTGAEATMDAKVIGDTGRGKAHGTDPTTAQ